MFTMEQKVNFVMRYIAATDKIERAEMMSRIIEALNDGETTPMRITPDIDDMIADFLREVGVPTNLLGYNYISYAIKLVFTDPTYTHKFVTKRLYPDIAAKYNTTSTRVERGIRHAIMTAFDRCDYDTLYSIFGNSVSPRKACLTNSEFITAGVNVISRRLKRLDTEVV